jgi:hypothetical protein
MWCGTHPKGIPFVSGLIYNNHISTKGYKMPNWVFNGLTIEGKPETVKQLMEQMNKPFKMVHDSWNMETGQMEKKLVTYPNPVFAFHNIYSYLDAGITEEDYLSQPPHNPDMTNWFKFEGNDWYNFNVREWGTKWDVAVSEDGSKDTYFEETQNGENYVVYYNFETAWSRPLAALMKLSAQYPTLLFTLSYEEETGWGGEMELLRGEVISNSEYDNKCRDCDATDQMEWCDNECGEICNNCHWLGEADIEAVEKCQTHKVYLDDKLPEYRKVES